MPWPHPQITAARSKGRAASLTLLPEVKPFAEKYRARFLHHSQGHVGELNRSAARERMVDDKNDNGSYDGHEHTVDVDAVHSMGPKH